MTHTVILVRLRYVLVATLILISVHIPLSAYANSETRSTVLEQAIVTLEGETIELVAPLRIKDDRLFAPLKSFTALFDASVVWNQDHQEITIHTATGNQIILGIGVPVVYYNGSRYYMDAVPLLENGRTYLPLRHVADLLGAKVLWNQEEQVASLSIISQAEVYEPALAVHIAEPFSEEDLTLLAKITMVESGYESYEGQLAVANVILNRVKDPRFPDTIKDVIYAGKQFPPAHNGLLDKSEPNESSLRAAKDALNGKNNIEDAIYFYNPKVTKGSFWSSLDVVATIGNHRFAK